MKTYKQHRKAQAGKLAWLYYGLALMFFAFAVKAFPVDGGSPMMFIWWIGATVGTIMGARREKKKTDALEVN